LSGNDSAAAPPKRAAAMRFIMVTTLIDMLSIGLIIPVLPVLVGQFTASLAEQAFWYGAVTFTFSVANFFASPVLGALSDHWGRRPVLLPSGQAPCYRIRRAKVRQLVKEPRAQDALCETCRRPH